MSPPRPVLEHTRDGRPVLLVLATYLSRRQAGAAHATINIINSLHRRGHVRVRVAAFEIEAGVLLPGVETSLLPLPPNRPVIWRVGRWMRARDYASLLADVPIPEADAMYTQSLELALAFRERNATTPMISHFGHVIARREANEESDLVGPWWWLDGYFANQLERRAYGLPHSTQVVSTRQVALARAEYFGLPEEFFLVQPLGIDIARFSDTSQREVVRRQLGLTDADRAIVSVARLVPWKNTDWLIRAMAVLPSHTHLVVVGEGPYRDALFQSVPPTLRRRVHLVGYVDPVPYLAASDIFALPSAIESFGVAYAEAMAMGLPAIGLRYQPPTILSSAEDVVTDGECGYVVRDEAELVKVLNELLTDDVRRREMGKRARARALTRFGNDAYAEFLETIMGCRPTDHSTTGNT